MNQSLILLQFSFHQSKELKWFVRKVLDKILKNEGTNLYIDYTK